ncbi:hypothetical protein QBC37DRAFT_278348 [Rhypophila decipiens]|uniref:Uncharacterized protein n=1 Tax=Rhypophila decipiens TaxID=261697 RepID=A0AAN6YE24_9PEZI|nr:hypothetical protein QBC37DRAFT_278348 [Rhypophila decipiens]
MSASPPTRVFPQPPTMATPSPSFDHMHNRDLALQKYVLLQEQHDSLRQHIDELRPLQSPFGGMVSPNGPLSASNRTSSVSSISSSTCDVSPYQSVRSHRRVSMPLAKPSCLETVLDETTVSEVALEEAKLCHVNEGIKRALTELLNCDAVREDRAFRTWVQGRLMDTERELRSGRRRRSAPEA